MFRREPDKFQTIRKNSDNITLLLRVSRQCDTL